MMTELDPGTTDSCATSPARTVVIWCIHDGKPGHRNQVMGLLEAIRRMRPVTAIDLPVQNQLKCWLQWLLRRFPAGSAHPAPALIIGAGHTTHPAVLAARRVYGGRAVILMRPTVPTGWFDLCIVPSHDEPKPSSNIITTSGALSTVTPGTGKPRANGLFLIGGPSAHHHWPQEKVIDQIRKIIESRSGLTYTLTTSRRTPPETLLALRELKFPDLSIVPFEETTPQWVPAQLVSAAEVWVSEDSVSMVYEALTSGAAVGLLELPRTGSGRVARGLDQLIGHAMVTPFERWSPGTALAPPAEPLREADRCAKILHERGLLATLNPAKNS